MRYVPALDGVRALAVIAVLAFHAQVRGGHGGFFGVDIFFVLSGYLITRLLVEEHQLTGKIELFRFWKRRLRRLYPALLTLLGVYLLSARFAFPQFHLAWHVQSAFVAAIYLSDYAWIADISLKQLAHTWSLAVEEQFYLAWPLLLLPILKLPKRYAIAAIVALYLASTAWRIHVVPDDFTIEARNSIYYGLHTHSSGLLLGCLAGFVTLKVPRTTWMYSLLVLGICCFLFDLRDRETFVVGFTVVEFAALGLILAAPAWLGSTALAWLGRMSYGWYLWHFPIMRLLGDHDWPPIALLVGGGALSLACAAISYYTIESFFRSGRMRGLRQPGISSAEAA